MRLYSPEVIIAYCRYKCNIFLNLHKKPNFLRENTVNLSENLDFALNMT